MIDGTSATRRILIATAIAGTLDIAAAMILTATHGGAIPDMLRYIASGPLPDAKGWGAAGAGTGLAVHYALIAMMAAAFVLAADRISALKRQALLWGTLYGIGLWAVMNYVVVPTRFGSPWPHDPANIAVQLFCHIVLVGIPTALVARRG